MTERRILVAGATGAIGRVLCPLLRADRRVVFGTTDKAIGELGWDPAFRLGAFHLD